MTRRIVLSLSIAATMAIVACASEDAPLEAIRQSVEVPDAGPDAAIPVDNGIGTSPSIVEAE